MMIFKLIVQLNKKYPKMVCPMKKNDFTVFRNFVTKNKNKQKTRTLKQIKNNNLQTNNNTDDHWFIYNVV